MIWRRLLVLPSAVKWIFCGAKEDGVSGDASVEEEDGSEGLLALQNQVYRFLEESPAVVENDEVMELLQSKGDAWSAMAQLGKILDVTGHKAISLRDMGAIQALFELAMTQLSMSIQGRVLLAANASFDRDRDLWIAALADDMRSIAEHLPDVRYAVATGYIALYMLMFSSLKPDADGMGRIEGFSSLTQAWWLSRQVSAVSTRRICEIGFNAGHSSMAMLLSAPRDASLISFDLGAMSYTPVCADFLRRVFPDGRFELIVGPSNLTLPRYLQQNLESARCDVIYIDGGHEEKEAGDDLLLMSLLAMHGRTLVIMDDIGCSGKYCPGPTAAWARFRKAGRLQELGCEVESFRRWCWGVYT